MEKIYYLDNAATTKVFDEEFDLIKENNKDYFYNPSASYKFAIQTKKKLENAKAEILNALKAGSGKLVFTSSATEANNMVFKGVHLRKGQVVLISKGEHPSVFESAKELEKTGIIVKLIPLTSEGIVDINELKNLLTSDVALVSIIHVSNETGAVNDIAELCKVVKNFNSKIIFHSDGVQAVGKIEVNLKKLGVDLYTMSAHKIYAPRGIAALYINNNVVIDALLVGGGQENGLRSSTENLDGAIALAYATKKVISNFNQNYEIAKNCKNTLIELLKNSKVSDFLKINSNNNFSPYILSLSFDGIKGEVLMNMLDGNNILISTGSACSSKKAGNRILEAMGLKNSEIVGSVRISFSPYEEYDLNYIADKIIECADKLYQNK